MKNSIKYKGKLNVIGPVIRKYREDLGLSQLDLSAKLTLIGIDIPKNSVQRLENGNRIIKEYELAAIAKILNVSTDELLKDFRKELDEQ